MKAYKKELTTEDKVQKMYNEFIREHAARPNTIELTNSEYKELDEADMISKGGNGASFVLRMKVVMVAEKVAQPEPKPEPVWCNHVYDKEMIVIEKGKQWVVYKKECSKCGHVRIHPMSTSLKTTIKEMYEMVKQL